MRNEMKVKIDIYKSESDARYSLFSVIAHDFTFNCFKGYISDALALAAAKRALVKYNLGTWK